MVALLAVRPQLFNSWTPADEGVLAQGADRFLNGELPHRDYTSLWSGGLDAIHALSFQLFGVRLESLRIMLVIAWLGGLAAMYAVARRFTSPWVAAALGAVGAMWTVPLSPHPLASWYTLFFALGGLAALARYLSTSQRRWLVLAGAAAGASVAIKITGLYFIAGVAMWMVWLVQERTPDTGAQRRTPGLYGLVIAAGLVTNLFLVYTVFSGVASVNAAVHYIAPTVGLTGVLIWREWARAVDSDAARWRRLVALVLPFAGGAAALIGVWVVPYLITGSLDDLVRGLFVTPRVRFTVASYPLPGLKSAGLAVLPWVLLLAAAPLARAPLGRRDRIGLVALVIVLAAFTYTGSPTVLVTWYGFRLLTPVAVLLGIVWLDSASVRAYASTERRALAFLLLAATAMCSLVQVPFALYTYFLYFVPLLVLAVAALINVQPAYPRSVAAALLAYALWFGWRQPGSLDRPTDAVRDRVVPLALARGNLLVSPEDSAVYGDLITAIERRSPGEWIFVWHDSPEIYFLSGRRNPTRTMFEAFEDSTAFTPDALRKVLALHDVRVVVLTDPAGAVRPLDPQFQTWVDSAFPGREWVRRTEVRWRDGALPLR